MQPVGKTERIEIRVTKRQKRLLQAAADVEGISLSDFFLSRMQPVARKIIRSSNQIQLTLEERVHFMQAYLNPEPPKAALLDLHEKRRKAVFYPEIPLTNSNIHADNYPTSESTTQSD